MKDDKEYLEELNAENEKAAPKGGESLSEPQSILASISEFKPAPDYGFICDSQGVYYQQKGVDKQGKYYEKPPHRLADQIELIGRGFDEQGNNYRVIRWNDRQARKKQIAVFATADIGSNWSWFQAKGIAILSGAFARNKLMDYLQTQGQEYVYHVTHKAGWFEDKAYILPSGEVFNAGGDRVIYNGDKSQAPYFEPSGALGDWQGCVARYCADNSRLCLALGTAFAAPLMKLLKEQSGAFHFFGSSSSGKTTAVKVALSVWGEPDALKLAWRGTDLGFSNVALARNDGLLVLDEVAEAPPRVVGATAYSVINGTSKTQGAKDGGNRPSNRWRILLLSTGEMPLDSYMRREGWFAGQAVRLPSIPADAGAGLGIFDICHPDFSSTAEQADYLNDATADFHGVAGQLFIENLLRDISRAKQEAEELRQSFMDSLPKEIGSQARRVAKRFALVSAALELACRYGITGIPESKARAAIRHCFNSWLERVGTGDYEERKILE